ncbi:MAG: thioesterase superfamily protein [Firmicutes bacterium]|nr:thioesterase superfamily protein [Bacillota bacterium]
MEGKSVACSKVVMSAVMQPNQANPAGNVHGGEIMKMMDNAAFVCAQRHALTNVVTARVDELTFHLPIYIGNLVTCSAHLTFVGRTSMEASVTVYVEDLYSNEPCRKALSGFFTMIALNAGKKPIRVPPLEIDTEEEKATFELGRVRYQNYQRLRKTNAG